MYDIMKLNIFITFTWKSVLMNFKKKKLISMSLMKRDGKGKENKQTACCYWQCLYWEADLKDDFDPMRKLDPCGQS